MLILSTRLLSTDSLIQPCMHSFGSYVFHAHERFINHTSAHLSRHSILSFSVCTTSRYFLSFNPFMEEEY